MALAHASLATPSTITVGDGGEALRLDDEPGWFVAQTKQEGNTMRDKDQEIRDLRTIIRLLERERYMQNTVENYSEEKKKLHDRCMRLETDLAFSQEDKKTLLKTIENADKEVRRLRERIKKSGPRRRKGKA